MQGNPKSSGLMYVESDDSNLCFESDVYWPVHHCVS